MTTRIVTLDDTTFERYLSRQGGAVEPGAETRQGAVVVRARAASTAVGVLARYRKFSPAQPRAPVGSPEGDDEQTAKAWDEAAHARQPAGTTEGGQFASTTTAAATATRPVPSEAYRAGRRERLKRVADQLRFPAEDITEHYEPGPVFTVGTDAYELAGSYNPATGRIDVYEGAFATDETLGSLVAHEVSHHQFRQTRRAHDLIERDPQYANDAGLLEPEARRRFPALAAWEDATDQYELLEAEDGVSPYSRAYWDAWKRGQTFPQGIWTPINETLAEMSAANYRTGFTPGGQRFRQAWRAMKHIAADVESGWLPGKHL